MNAPIKLGLWGNNGHQVHEAIEKDVRIELLAFGAFSPELEKEFSERYPLAKPPFP